MKQLVQSPHTAKRARKRGKVLVNLLTFAFNVLPTALVTLEDEVGYEGHISFFSPFRYYLITGQFFFLKVHHILVIKFVLKLRCMLCI